MRRSGEVTTLARRTDAAAHAARALRARRLQERGLGRPHEEHGGEATPPLRVADVALFYGERSGGIRTYLDAKVEHAQRSAMLEHHLITPGPVERHDGGRHELRSLRIATTNGYRLPLGVSALKRTLRDVRPDVVLLHDPFWGPLGVSDVSHEVGALVVAVHHGSSDLDAAGMPGRSEWWAPVFRAWLRRAASRVDAVMSAVDPTADCGRPADLPLRLGVDAAFRPPIGVRRGDHVLCAGRLAREKGVFTLLEAAARTRENWELRFVGSGPAERALRERAERLGIARRVTFAPFISDRHELARAYAQARAVVMPGAHETFGLVALEAACSGARVVACETAPSARVCAALAHTFRVEDTDDLARVISQARRAAPDPAAAADLARRRAWPRLFAEELAGLRALSERRSA